MSALCTTLAAEINVEHERAFGKAREALEHARRAGELLLQAKADLPHGEWLPWLKANITFSERSAQGYMRLASRWDALQAKSATGADLGLKDALTALADVRDVHPELGDSCELSTNLHDGRLIVISPAAEHAGYFFVDCVDTKNWLAEGWDRPVLGAHVPACLDVLGMPKGVPWCRHEGQAPRAGSRWMRDKPADLYAHCVALGIMQ